MSPFSDIYLQSCGSLIGLGCCDFQFQTKDSSIIHGRSMEYPLETGSRIFARNKNTQFHSFAPDGIKTVSWESKFGYIGIDMLGFGKPVEGINEKGLSISFLSIDDCQYTIINEENKNVALVVLDLGDYILGTCSNVDEALEAVSKIAVWCPTLPQINKIPGVHVALHDAFGKNYVIEFVKGKTKSYSNPIGVLTNDPRFRYHQQNLRNYLGSSSNPLPDINYRDVELKNLGPGTGMKLPGGLDSVSRFVRLSNLIKTATIAENALKGVSLAFHHLNAMDKPEGCCNADVSGQFFSDHTRWSVVMDLSNKVLFYRSYQDLGINLIDLKQISFEKDTEHKFINLVGEVQTVNDVTHML